MELYNVRKITLSGNEITRVATDYNPYIKNKDKTAVTVKTLEDAITLNKVECDFDFNKQHETNMSYDELIIKDSKTTETSAINAANTAKIYFDQTYHIKVCYDATADKAYYPTDALNTVTSDILFIASKVKIYDSNVNYDVVMSNGSLTGTTFTIPKTVTEVRISQKLTGYKISRTATSTDPVAKIYAPKANIENGVTAATNTELYVDQTYADPAITSSISVSLLYLTSKYFNNKNLDEITTANYFGDFSASTVTAIKVEYNGLYTAKEATDATLITKLETVLGASGKITLDTDY